MSKHVIPGFRLNPGDKYSTEQVTFACCAAYLGSMRSKFGPRLAVPFGLGIIDTETTGLDPDANEVIELVITVMTINVDGRLQRIEVPISWLEQPSLPLEPKIVLVTGLTDADLMNQSFDDHEIADELSRCDVLVSRNVRFDRAFLARRFSGLVDRPWGCSASDIDWLSHDLGGRSLGHLAYEAGYFYEAHRAVPDSWALACLLMGEAADGRTYAAHLVDVIRSITHRIYARRAPFEVKDRLKARGAAGIRSSVVGGST